MEEERESNNVYRLIPNNPPDSNPDSDSTDSDSDSLLNCFDHVQAFRNLHEANDPNLILEWCSGCGYGFRSVGPGPNLDHHDRPPSRQSQLSIQRRGRSRRRSQNLPTSNSRGDWIDSDSNQDRSSMADMSYDSIIDNEYNIIYGPDRPRGRSRPSQQQQELEIFSSNSDVGGLHEELDIERPRDEHSGNRENESHESDTAIHYSIFPGYWRMDRNGNIIAMTGEEVDGMEGYSGSRSGSGNGSSSERGWRNVRAQNTEHCTVTVEARTGSGRWAYHPYLTQAWVDRMQDSVDAP